MPDVASILSGPPRSWLVTGCAGFIGSNLLEVLLAHGQRVTGLDNFSTGFRHNLDQVQAAVGAEAWSRFRFIEGDIRDLEACRDACTGVDFVLHEAALGSVPRSIEDPIASHASNVTGFLNMLVAARDAKVKRFVYAASSAAYGDWPGLPKVEDQIGRPLSPYGAGKYMNELYADVFGRCYGFPAIGLRYFNVFGPRQDPASHYAAVIPKFITAALRGTQPTIFGDGSQSRDFCFIDNVVEANLKACAAPGAPGRFFNVACGQRTTLLDVLTILSRIVGHEVKPRFEPSRTGDIRHSLADISRAREVLGYSAAVRFDEGLARTVEWYRERA